MEKGRGRSGGNDGKEERGQWEGEEDWGERQRREAEDGCDEQRDAEPQVSPHHPRLVGHRRRNHPSTFLGSSTS